MLHSSLQQTAPACILARAMPTEPRVQNMRKIMVAGNWKMNGSQAMIRELF
ncbi:MAG: hypothetical protein ACI9R7_002106, partial [Lysobacterales bacterium]